MLKFLIIALLFFPVTSVAQFNELPPELREIGIDENLGQVVPHDIELINENGEIVTIGEYLQKGKPLIITPIYFECPMLCNLILNGLTEGLQQLNWQVGDQFEILTFSFNPEESSQLASDKKKSYLRLLGKPEVADGWHFNTASQENIDRLTEAMGFRYKWSDEAQEFLHGSALVFVSPNGTITRYLYGVTYTELSLRNALFDAAEGRIGSVLERVMLFCYTYDPDSRSYVANAINIMKIGGLLTMTFLSIFLGLLWFRNKSVKTINA